MCFGLVMLATVPFSIWPGGALGVFVDSYLKVVMVFVLMMNTLTTPKRLEQMTWLILVCCGYIAFRAVFDYARGVNLVENGRVAGAVSGIFGNPNDLALNMVTFLPAALMFALTPAVIPPLRRLIAAGIAVLMLATVVFTKSRAGVLGLGCHAGGVPVPRTPDPPGVHRRGARRDAAGHAVPAGVVLEPHGHDRRRAAGQGAVHRIEPRRGAFCCRKA